MGKFVDITGQRYGRLTVISRSENNRHKKAMWRCRCDCGNEAIFCGNHLRSGNTQSCGCLAMETRINNGKSVVKHRGRGTRLYHVWSDIKIRCFNSKSSNYANYGGRGITMCDEWRNDFATFRDWSIANGYDETAPKGQYTIERINVNGNYEPSNCRWATTKEQGNNRRNNHLLTYDGETHTIAEWSEITGIRHDTLLRRLKKGWTPEKTLTEPVKGR